MTSNISSINKKINTNKISLDNSVEIIGEVKNKTSKTSVDSSFIEIINETDDNLIVLNDEPFKVLDSTSASVSIVDLNNSGDINKETDEKIIVLNDEIFKVLDSTSASIDLDSSKNSTPNKNESVGKKLKKKLKKKKKKKKKQNTIMEVDNKETENNNLLNDNNVDVSETNKDDDDDNEVVDDDLFQIDTNPTKERQMYNYSGPRYNSKFSDSAFTEDKSSKQKPQRSNTCFNCLGNHALRDCDAPRNQFMINKNRNEFMANRAKQMGNVSASRYHLDHHQKYAHIKPGKISKTLRKALNLKHDQLPLHIYKMRHLGYPPAWLEEAKVNHSGIIVHDSSGNVLADPEDEDGEVDASIETKCKYDINKIIEYPGFNVKPSKGTLNESDYLGFPEMSPEQSKEKMMALLAPHAATPYKKRKLEANELSNRDSIGLNEKSSRSDGEEGEDNSHMDIEDIEEETKFEPAGNCTFIPSLPDEEPVLPPLPAPPPTSCSQGGKEEDDDEEGEIKDDDIVQMTNTVFKGRKRKSDTTGDTSDNKKQKLLSIKSNQEKVDTSASLISTISSSSSTSTSTPTSTSQKQTLTKYASVPNLGTIKQIEIGTPVINHCVSMEKLPSHEKFSKNICDVINFDNLPDSTGKYKVLNKVIKKVRTFMTKITKSS